MKPITDKDRKKDYPHARAIVAKVNKWINPDNFVGQKYKQQKFEKICTLVNKVINRLKGFV